MLYRMIRLTDINFPIPLLFLFFYYMQYIFAPYLSYFNYDDLALKMPLSDIEYFGYILPAIFALFLGFFWRIKRFNIKPIISRVPAGLSFRFGFLLVCISYFFDVLSLLNIGIIQSLFSFTTYLKYLGAFCFLFSGRLLGYVFVFLIYLQLLLAVLSSGVFVSFFIWSMFLFFFYSLRYNLKIYIKVIVVIVSILIVVIVQGVKHEYRNRVWNEEEKGSIGLITNLAAEEGLVNEENLSQSKGFVRTIARLNQGWHLGLVLSHVPEREPIASGKEMAVDILSSFVPRILFEDKKSVNSQDKFYKYTGHKLLGNTSMSIGLIGDFYINFGFTGSIVMLFLFGAAIGSLLNFFIINYTLKDPINIIWLPFLFSYLMRANNDFYIFFNNLVKGFLVFFILQVIRSRFLR